MKNTNYYGQYITVYDEVAKFLEQDRRREAAQRRSDRRHLNFVGSDITSMADLFTNAYSDPTFDKAYHNLRLEKLRYAYQFLSDDERRLLCLYYYHEFSMEQIGQKLGVTKMAVSKRLRKILNLLRSLMENGTPQKFFRKSVYGILICVLKVKDMKGVLRCEKANTKTTATCL